MHEIITLQLGQRSNYIATHFWNTQESYFTYSRDEESLVDHDIHFRPGIGADGSETFTPRTLIYDLKGGFGSLKQINALYELEDEGNNIPKGLWDGPKAIQTLPPIPSSSYQKSLEEGTTPPPLSVDTVKYWSDFNRVFYHPKSIVQLNDYDLESTLMPFERWDTGEELFSALDREHDLLDRDLRPFAEESDQLQGIQMMTSADDAWAGFAARYMDRLRDEYGKISLWVFGVEDGKQAPRNRQMTKDLNSAKTLCELSSLASMYIPVAMPRLSLPFYVKLDTQSQWHTSALLATAIESSTLISRLQQDQRVGLGDIENELNINGAQKIAQLCFDIRAEDDSSTISKTGFLSKPGSALGKTTARTENSSNDAKSEGRFGRGGIDEELQGVVPRVIDLFPASEEGSWTQRSTFGASDVHRGSHEADSSGTGRSKMESPIIHIHRTPLRFPQPDSFPHIFRFRNQDPTPLKIHTSLSTSSQVAIRLKHLQRALGRIPGLQESEDIQNGLNDLRTEYEEGWNSGSDEDNDDY